MSEAEHNNARIRLKARLKQLELAFERTLCTAQELAEAKQQYEALVQHKPDGRATDNARPMRDERPWVPEGQTLPPATVALLEGLRARFSATDLQKAELSNSLASVPVTEPCLALVQAILALRGELMETKDQIDYVTLHGAMPSQEPGPTDDALDAAWRKALPADKVQINQMLLNERSNLSKNRKKQGEAKTATRQQHYAIVVAKAERRLAALDSILRS